MFEFLIPAAASLIGGAMQSRQVGKAQAAEREQQDKALQLQERMYEEGVQRQQPFLTGGTEDYNRLRSLMTGGPEAAQQFLQMDPGYGFRLSEGMKALERGAAARGGLLSGNMLRGAQRYGQDLASQEFGQAYNRLAQLANVGPAAAGVMNTLGQQYATGAGNIYGAMGQSAGQAQLARGSIYGKTLNRLGSLGGEYFGAPTPSAFTPGGMASSGFGSGMAFGNEDLGQYFSDRRLKTNISRVGTRPDGLGVYEFEYVWGGPRHRGLMAQEVRELYPDAVSERDGYLMVDYRKV